MQRLWLVQQTIEGLTAYFTLADRDGSGSLIRKQAAVLASATHGSPRVTPELAIDDEAFELDFFEDGTTFASARLIEAMALPENVIQLGDVDDTACSRAVRRIGFRTLALRASGNPIDRDASDGFMVTWTDKAGVTRSEWLLAEPQPNRPASKVRWRGDFKPAADLFLAKGTPWRLATDALAARVMRLERPASLSWTRSPARRRVIW